MKSYCHVGAVDADEGKQWHFVIIIVTVPNFISGQMQQWNNNARFEIRDHDGNI